MFWKKNNKETENLKNPKNIWRGFSASDIGMVRAQNEDAVFLSTRFGEKEFALAIVCDGMGGHAAGDVASQMCIKTITEFLKNKTPNQRLVVEALQMANEAIYSHAISNPELKGMGTTCSALIAHGQQMFWAHVGDSHIYRLQNDIRVINEDHTLEYQKKKDGLPVLPGDEHVLTKAMGTRESVEPQSGTLKLDVQGDIRFLLCTDGLYNLVSDEELLVLAEINPASLSAQALVALAKERGGHDNISICILDRVEIQLDNQETFSN